MLSKTVIRQGRTPDDQPRQDLIGQLSRLALLLIKMARSVILKLPLLAERPRRGNKAFSRIGRYRAGKRLLSTDMTTACTPSPTTMTAKALSRQMRSSDRQAFAAGRGKKGASLGVTLALFLAGMVLPAAAQQTSETIQMRAVIELFTSQGCASCPPADNLIKRYARDSSIIVLTLPVTCWDYLGWRDTLAKDHFTIRQRIYAKIRGSRSIYTPQAVINGMAHMVGSDEAAIGGALETTPASALPVKVDITSAGDAFRIVVADTNTSEHATILLAPFYRKRSVSIGDGENAGKRLTYTNVVSSLLPIGQLPSASSSTGPLVINLPRSNALPDSTDGFAILIQTGNPDSPGKVIGAASFLQPLQ